MIIFFLNAVLKFNAPTVLYLVPGLSDPSHGSPGPHREQGTRE